MAKYPTFFSGLAEFQTDGALYKGIDRTLDTLRELRPAGAEEYEEEEREGEEQCANCGTTEGSLKKCSTCRKVRTYVWARLCICSSPCYEYGKARLLKTRTAYTTYARAPVVALRAHQPILSS